MVAPAKEANQAQRGTCDRERNQVLNMRRAGLLGVANPASRI